MGGMVLETNITEVVTHIEAQGKVEKSESSPTMSIKVRSELFYDGFSKSFFYCSRRFLLRLIVRYQL